MTLRLDFCSRDAATFAVKAWHYSRSLPAGRMVTIGAVEDDRFVGALVFSRGAASNIGRPFGLTQDQIAELTRIALQRGHRTPTSRILAIACRLLKRQSRGLKALISYADPRHRHDGRGVYAAAGWLYLGPTQPERQIVLHGKLTHARTVSSRYGTRSIAWLRANVDPHAEHVIEAPKHKYILPLDGSLAARLRSQAQPYPTRASHGVCGAHLSARAAEFCKSSSANRGRRDEGSGSTPDDLHHNHAGEVYTAHAAASSNARRPSCAQRAPAEGGVRLPRARSTLAAGPHV